MGIIEYIKRYRSMVSFAKKLKKQKTSQSSVEIFRDRLSMTKYTVQKQADAVWEMALEAKRKIKLMEKLEKEIAQENNIQKGEE